MKKFKYVPNFQIRVFLNMQDQKLASSLASFHGNLQSILQL